MAVKMHAVQRKYHKNAAGPGWIFTDEDEAKQAVKEIRAAVKPGVEVKAYRRYVRAGTKSLKVWAVVPRFKETK